MNLFKTLIIALVVSAAGSLAACNTIHGAGQDVERAGEAVQRGADRARPN
jgi:entericidin B